ncbi:glycosyltransferase [Roseicella aquatilis]|uniref:Glycosyltransferase n=1 Tax=Roseicella aquatilis TaxID=2527868 RepID=A0A4R4D2T1_9PROT|nr:glycosyltransferase [Roseicella aquatilis]TCZ52612.1 glycosyltransferase [Roseicella aquatilis]
MTTTTSAETKAGSASADAQDRAGPPPEATRPGQRPGHQGRAASDAQVASLRRQLARLEREHQAALQAQAGLTQELAQARHHLDLILASTIWRATGPMRRLAAQLPQPLRHSLRRATAGLLRGLRLRRAVPALAVAPAALLLPEAEDPRTEALPLLDPLATEAGSPLASFLITVEDPAALPRLRATLDSLRAQAGAPWQALIGLPAALAEAAAPLVGGEGRIRLHPVERGGAEAGGTAARLDAMLRQAEGEMVGVLDCGDRLAPDALAELARAVLRDPAIDVFYSDEATGEGGEPFLKPGWSPEMLRAFPYFGRLSVLRRELALEAGGFAPDLGEAAEWHLFLQATRLSDRVGRIARILCHRAPEAPPARPPAGTPAAALGREALRRFWATQGIEAAVTTQPNGTQRATWPLRDPPLVSVVIPTRDKPELLRTCLRGLLEGTAYPRKEIILVDTGSREPATQALYREMEGRPEVTLLRYETEFNYSAACNLGARAAGGGMLLFLNNDIEVTDPDWLTELVRTALVPGVGVVGTRLHYPDGTLQHAGVVVGMHVCGLVFHRAPPGEWGVFGSPDLPRNWLGIMGACQLVRRETFERVGGFDETYRVSNSDVALCLRAWRAGYRTVCTPYAALVHHEGATRGHTNPEEDLRRTILDIHRLGFEEDPFFHPALNPQNPVPTLAGPGDPSPRENLARDVARLRVADGAERFSLFDESALMRACGLDREQILWPALLPGDVCDSRTAARYLLDLLRSRADLRLRFPRALTGGAEGAFARWLLEEAAPRLGLGEAACALLREALADGAGRRVRQLVLAREDVRACFPLGCTPAGLRGLFTWLVRHGREESGLEPEEILWFCLECQEDPAGELLRTYRFTPEWQRHHPDGLTVFGRHGLAAWLREKYLLDEAWLDPAGWPLTLPADRQVRLAWQARPDWRRAHPAPFADAAGALALLDWLASPAAGLEPEARAWCAALDREAVARDLATPGMNFIGHFCYPSGLRTSLEALVDGAMAQGIRVSRRDLRTDSTDDPRHAEFDGLEAFDVTLLHTQPEPFFREAYARSDLHPRWPRCHRIAYWYWELETVPDYWRQVAEEVDEVWTATRFVGDALRKCLDKPVHVVMPGLRLPPFTPRPRRYFGLPENRFTFLFVFHMMSIMERKNPHALIRAFRQAFGGDDTVSLVLKTTNGDRHPKLMQELQAAAEDAGVTLIDAVYTQDETLSLMQACDCYVSLHRSEGLGLTMAEAMLLGKPVIATGYSGNLDFMNAGNSLLVDYELVQLGQAVPPYDAEACWADPSVEHAAELMRRVHDDPGLAARLGRRARADLLDLGSSEAAGERIAARLAAIRERAGGHVTPSPVLLP